MLTPAAEYLQRGRDHGNYDDGQNHQGEILLHVRDISKEMPEQNDAEDPNEGPNDVVGEEFPVVHGTHAGHKRSEGANERNKPGKHDRFGSVPLVEGVRLLQVLPVENTTLGIAEEFLADFIPDPIIRGMTQNSCAREQEEDEGQIQRTILGRQSTNCKQKCVAREKRSYDQTGLGKDDQEEESVDPITVGISDSIEIKIQVQDDIEEFYEPVHRRKRQMNPSRRESLQLKSKR
jgi:hypothetical protein